MAKCRNPECRNGLTPGLIIRGKGNAKVPVLGQEMKWGWVRCPACNLDEESARKGVKYTHIERSATEISQRAALADAKAPYKQVSNSRLVGVRARQEAKPERGSNNDEKLTKLLDQVTNLTTQVSELLTENRELRKQLEARNQGAQQP